jgi:hypothetical protein
VRSGPHHAWRGPDQVPFPAHASPAGAASGPGSGPSPKSRGFGPFCFSRRKVGDKPMTTLLVPEIVAEPGAAEAFITAVLLVGFMIAKEIVISVADPPNRVAVYILDVALAPLFVTFIATIAFGLLPSAR